MNKKVRVGVLGAKRGVDMIKVLERHPDAKLVAICDKYQPLLNKCYKLAEKTGSKITCYNKFDNFFNHDMDAVILANYANEHSTFAVRLLNSGRHVASEVLAVSTMAEAVKLVEAVESSGKVYSYAENYCYFRSNVEAKRLYRKGDLGEFLHGEGEYVHDCESDWPSITYGDKTHWRNNFYSTFYCTHSIGPIIFITGAKPVKVVGFETRNTENLRSIGYRGAMSGMEMIQMNNGATVKSLHGLMKREPPSIWYSIYGEKGMIESNRYDGVNNVFLFREGSEPRDGIIYEVPPIMDNELAKSISGHAGSDFFTMHYFLEKILDRPGGEECIDVYQALDMTIPGILAYRSILNGNIPIEVPDLRDKKVRNRYRNDHFFSLPKGPEVQLCSHGDGKVTDEIYEAVRRKWQAKFIKQTDEP